MKKKKVPRKYGNTYVEDYNYFINYRVDEMFDTHNVPMYIGLIYTFEIERHIFTTD